MSFTRSDIWRQALLIGLAASALPFGGGGWLLDDFVHVHRLVGYPTVAELFSSADPFGFYRPVAQASWLVDAVVWEFDPVMWRVTNGLIHILVVLLAYCFARQVLTRQGAFLAALTFVLTPKAHAIAVLWVSARPELFMSVFSFAALLCWVTWERHGRARWLAGAGVCYVLALLSKETAALLPVLMSVTWSEAGVVTRRRVLGASLIAALAVVPLGLRMSAGGLMPTSPDDHYAWVWTADRWLRGIEVYLPRALPSAVGLLILVTLPVTVVYGRRASLGSAVWNASTLRWTVYAMAWFVVFIAPALPVIARSELYLYLPGFGFGLLAGYLTDRVLTTIGNRQWATVALVVYIAGFIGYQVSREVQTRRVLTFTSALVDAIEVDAGLRAYRGDVTFIPADRRTEQLLRDGVSGYINIIVQDTLHRDDIYAAVEYADRPRQDANGARIRLAYAGDRVVLSVDAGDVLLR